MSRDRQHRFRWETTRALGAAIRTICAPAPGTTLAGNDRPRAFPNRRPEVHNYPLGATSTPVFEKDLLRADGDGTGRSTHANQVLFAKYARSYIAINKHLLITYRVPWKWDATRAAYTMFGGVLANLWGDSRVRFSRPRAQSQ